jgi:hypothetical protein
MRIAIVLACACSSPPAPVKPEMADGLSIRFREDDTKLYFDIAGKRGFSCTFLADGDVVMVHHASAKLGIARYVRGKDGTYDPQAKTYDWRSGEEMMSDMGWTATTMQDGATEQHVEFLKKTVGTRRIAIGYLMLPASNDLDEATVGTWPPKLTDGVTSVQLLAGFNPDDVTFAPETWSTQADIRDRAHAE